MTSKEYILNSCKFNTTNYILYSYRDTNFVFPSVARTIIF